MKVLINKIQVFFTNMLPYFERLSLVYTYDASRSISTSISTREWNDFHSLVLVLMLASLRRTCKPGRRKHKHKRKEITHALPFAKWRQQIFMLLRLRMSPYAHAYCTCKHPCAYACAYAYACVVRVNQALGCIHY